MVAEVGRRRPGFGMELVQYLLLLASEAAWIYPWTLAFEFWIRQKQRPLLELPILVALLAGALVATRLATVWPKAWTVPGERPPRRVWRVTLPGNPLRVAVAYLARALVVGVGLAAAVLVGLNELPTFLAGEPWEAMWQEVLNSDPGARAGWAGVLAGVLWWRGIRLGRFRPSLEAAEDEFALGVVALATLLALAALAGQVFPFPGNSLLLSTLAFLFAGLVGVPLARIAEVNARPRHQSGQRPGLSGCWLATLLGVVGSLLLGSLLLAQLLSFERIMAVWDAVSGPLGAVLTAVVYVLALPVALLVEVVAFLLRLLPQSQGRPLSPQRNPDLLSDFRQEDLPPLSPEWIFALKLILIVALAAALVWLLIRAISRLGDRWAQNEVEEIRDSVWSWPGPGGLWRWLLRLWRPLRTRVASLAVAARLPGERSAEARGIRELYRHFLALGAKVGRARRADETPLEYQRRLGGDDSLAGGEEVSLLTDGYNRARYAPPPPRPPDSAPFTAALARLRTLWQTRGLRPGTRATANAESAESAERSPLS